MVSVFMFAGSDGICVYVLQVVMVSVFMFAGSDGICVYVCRQ